MSSKLAIVCALACLAATLPALAAGETERPDTLALPTGVLELDALRVDAPLALVTHTGAALVRVHGELVIDAPLSARSATRAPGADGADLVLEADGIVLTANGTLRAEDGARGADALAWDGSDVFALPGGAGGDILLRAPSIRLEGALQPGRGGDGGHALAYRGGDATGGAGGPSGVALAHDANGPRLVGGADGGDGGDAISVGDDLDVTRMCAPPKCGMPGGVGPVPTPGELCTEDGRCFDIPEQPCLDCVPTLPVVGYAELLAAIAKGAIPPGKPFEPGGLGLPGRPGFVEPCETGQKPIGNPGTSGGTAGDGGDGGDAYMCGADGAHGGSGEGGTHGWSCGPGGTGAPGSVGVAAGSATGGPGGSSVKGTGGDGGDAFTQGGNGGNGGAGGPGGWGPSTGRCPGGQGGNGGAGGDAGMAQAGKGGDGLCGGGKGGQSSVKLGTPGEAGVGGAGNPPGEPGTPGANGTAGASIGGAAGLGGTCG